MQAKRFNPAQENLILQELIRDEFRKSLFLTARDLLCYKDMTWFTHGRMVTALEHPWPQKLIVCPRGSFKSSLCVVSYTVWLLLNNPNLRIFIVSEVYKNSKNFIREIRAHLKGEKFVSKFGDWEGEPWGESEITVKARTDIKKEASVTAGGIGTIKVGQHYDVIIIDDANSNKNSSTPEGLQKIIDYYRYLVSILDPGGIMAVIGTRYAALDLIGYILENECGIKDIKKEVPLHNERILNGRFSIETGSSGLI